MQVEFSPRCPPKQALAADNFLLETNNDPLSVDMARRVGKIGDGVQTIMQNELERDLAGTNAGLPVSQVAVRGEPGVESNAVHAVLG